MLSNPWARAFVGVAAITLVYALLLTAVVQVLGPFIADNLA